MLPFLIRWLAALSAIFLLVHLKLLVDRHSEPNHPEKTSVAEHPTSIHPIERLHRLARENHTDLLSRQSSTLSSAVATYRQRYGAEPPPGFDRWFELAINANSTIIDGFDLIPMQLRPFRHYLWRSYDRSLSQREIEQLAEARIIRVCFEAGQIKVDGNQADLEVKVVKTMLAPFAGFRRDICVFLNALDEPRAVLPRGQLPPGLLPKKHELEFGENANHAGIWSDVSLPCWSDASNVNRESADRGSNTHDTSSGEEPEYAQDWWSDTDVCSQPEIRANGFIQSPSSAKLTHNAVPILSAAKLSTFSDVLTPSIFRFKDNSVYDEAEDTAWDDKTDEIYWRGQTTGGHGTASNWHLLHRQKLIQQMAHDSRFNVAFSAIAQCDPDACEEQKQMLPTSERQPMSESWKRKVVLDVDGNGLSGRLYGLLRSRSAVMRHSFMREWHDERLQPWLHYIPLTAGAQEMHALADFLFSDPRGEVVLKGIAEAGRDWAARALRRQDMQLYFIRLLLEMARDR